MNRVGQRIDQVVIIANRVVFVAFLLAGVAWVGGFTLIELGPPLEVYGGYAVVFASLLGPYPLLGGMIFGTLAAGLHLFGRRDGFWSTVAPLNLGFVCLVLAELLVQPPPAVGGFIMIVLGTLIIGAVTRLPPTFRRGAPLVFLAIPFLGINPHLRVVAPLATAILFIGIWAATRLGWKAFRFQE